MMQHHYDMFNGVLQEGDKIVLKIPEGVKFSKLITDFEFKIGTDMTAAEDAVRMMVSEN